MPDGDPKPGECYRASPETSIDKDVHGENKRPVGVVERLPRTVTCLGRTTHPEAGAMTIPSAQNDALELDKVASWTNRHQRSVSKDFWGTDKFRYLGRLPESEAAALAKFWENLGMLGRRNE